MIVLREYPGGEVDLAMAKDMTPDPARIYEDHVNARWQVYWPNVGSRSRAWHMHGHREACRQVLAWAWSERLAADGLSVADCPIQGLFAPSPGASACKGAMASSASSSAPAA